MHTANLPAVCSSVATRCQHQAVGPQVTKFEQFSSLGHQVSLAGARAVGVLYSEVPCLGVLLQWSQCITGNGHMGPSNL